RPATAQGRGAAALGEVIAGLPISTRVLMIGAHPDDEDTRLITWLARGRHVETAYLSLTRGDGGQNLIGNQLGEALGVIRTEELLAARRVDGAHQFFTRAYDFGFSKSADEAFSHWPHDSLLGDAVTVIRSFRPQVIISVFSGTPRDGHGQHQVAGQLAREAFDAAADTVRFPREKTLGLGGWTPLKFYRGAFFAQATSTLCMNVGEYSPLLGESYAEIAAESRSQHKSQGFGVLQRKGARLDCVKREASRVSASADPKQETSLFDGMDTTVYGIRPLLASADRAKLDSLRSLIAGVQQRLNLAEPSGVVASLARAGELAAAMVPAKLERRPTDAEVRLGDALLLLLGRIDQALQLATGVAIEANAPREVVAIGDSVPVTVTVYDRGRQSVTLAQLTAGGESFGGVPATAPLSIAPDSSASVTFAMKAVARTSPWWLETPRVGDLFSTRIDGSTAEQRIATEVSAYVQAGPARFVVTLPVVFHYADPVRGDINRPLAAAPPLSLTLDRTVEYARANTPLTRTVRVEIRSAAADARTGVVSLRLPAGLTADSSRRSVELPQAGSVRSVTFTVRGSLAPGRHTVSASVESAGQHYTAGYIPIEYDHIHPQRIYRDAAMSLEAVDVKLPPRLHVAYILGVGDNVAPMLQQLGVPLTLIDPAALASTNLGGYSTVVVGPRAYESSPELVANNSRLLDYVKNGGTMIVQYGQYEMTRPGMMPYPITIAQPHDRVTDENAPLRLLVPDHPVFTTPNRITSADFSNWVQERSLYMARSFDSHYAPLISMNDPGEPPNSGSLLIAPYGRGTYVYTALAFFRQLPAGNPGAARLFANLLGAMAPSATP
nr:PIG-L family deacetylase [Gemmatimonadota bacterium]